VLRLDGVDGLLAEEEEKVMELIAKVW